MKVVYWQCGDSPRFLRPEAAVEWVKAQGPGLTTPSHGIKERGTIDWPSFKDAEEGDVQGRIASHIGELAAQDLARCEWGLNRLFAKHPHRDIHFGWVLSLGPLQSESTVQDLGDNWHVTYTAPVLISWELDWEHELQPEVRQEGQPYQPRKTERRHAVLMGPKPLWVYRDWMGGSSWYLDPASTQWGRPIPAMAERTWTIDRCEQDYVD